MSKYHSINSIFIISIFFLFCSIGSVDAQSQKQQLKTGAERSEVYLPLLKGKKVGIVANHTALVENVHLVDLLIDWGVNLQMVFAPEHGFRGKADAGEYVASYTDKKTGVEVLSIYGNRKKPDPSIVKKLDVVLFDIQDVGLRYYTYLSSMHYMMESCAEAGVPFIVLDRPNPNGMYVDGPVLERKHRSFVGMHPIPTVHGMTLGELAQMINGEKWLKNEIQCDLTVIPCEGYTHQTRYELPVQPSPNLPNMRSIYLYPSLCFFEGTPVSIGRGTDFPFQVYGHPKLSGRSFSFTPESREGATKPPRKGEKCWGVDLRHTPSNESLIARGVNLSYLVETYKEIGGGNNFFLPIFKLLTGVDYIQEMIIAGYSANEIESRWKEDVAKFRQQRKPYLLYEE